MKEVTCVVCNIETDDKYGMKYSKDALQKAIDEYNKKSSRLGILGDRTEMATHLEDVSHSVEEVNVVGDNVIAKVNLFDTPRGKLAQELINSGHPLKMEPRIVAEPVYDTDENGEPDYSKIIGYENPEIISIDIV